MSRYLILITVLFSFGVVGCPKVPTAEELREQRQKEVLETIEEDIEDIEDLEDAGALEPETQDGSSDAPQFIDSIPSHWGDFYHPTYEVIGC